MMNSQPFVEAGTAYEKVSKIVAQLQTEDINFDVRLALDMEKSLFLDKLEKIARYLNENGATKEKYNYALERITRLKMELKLLSFGKIRTGTFKSEMSNAYILSGDLSKSIDHALVLSKILGMDDVEGGQK